MSLEYATFRLICHLSLRFMLLAFSFAAMFCHLVASAVFVLFLWTILTDNLWRVSMLKYLRVASFYLSWVTFIFISIILLGNRIRSPIFLCNIPADDDRFDDISYLRADNVNSIVVIIINGIDGIKTSN